MRKMPKLAVGTDTQSHLVVGMITHTGGRGDTPDFHWLIIDAWCRCRFDAVLADAGYESYLGLRTHGHHVVDQSEGG